MQAAEALITVCPSPLTMSMARETTAVIIIAASVVRKALGCALRKVLINPHSNCILPTNSKEKNAEPGEIRNPRLHDSSGQYWHFPSLSGSQVHVFYHQVLLLPPLALPFPAKVEEPSRPG